MLQYCPESPDLDSALLQWVLYKHGYKLDQCFKELRAVVVIRTRGHSAMMLKSA